MENKCTIDRKDICLEDPEKDLKTLNIHKLEAYWQEIVAIRVEMSLPVPEPGCNTEEEEYSALVSNFRWWNHSD